MITSTVDRENDLTVITVEGDVTGKELADSVREFYAGNPTDRLVWDFSGASFEKITIRDLQMVSRTAGQYAVSRKRGKTALVFAADVGYGLGRMYEAFREAEDSPVGYRSFRSMDEALSWLGPPARGRT